MALDLNTVSLYAGIVSLILALVKYAVDIYKTKTVKDDWIGHILIILAIVFILLTIFA